MEDADFPHVCPFFCSAGGFVGPAHILAPRPKTYLQQTMHVSYDKPHRREKTPACGLRAASDVAASETKQQKKLTAFHPETVPQPSLPQLSKTSAIALRGPDIQLVAAATTGR